MKEKLIELLAEAIHWKDGIARVIGGKRIDEIADHLIANGVCVMPCKIGDDIWWIDAETDTVECDKNGVSGFIVKKDEILIMDKAGSEDRIGTQYCYLSREDAEAALKEGAVNGH